MKRLKNLGVERWVPPDNSPTDILRFTQDDIYALFRQPVKNQGYVWILAGVYPPLVGQNDSKIQKTIGLFWQTNGLWFQDI